MHDRKLADRSGLYATGDAMAVVDRAYDPAYGASAAPARVAQLELRLCRRARPGHRVEFPASSPEAMPLRCRRVRGHAPAWCGAASLRLLTSHEVTRQKTHGELSVGTSSGWIIGAVSSGLKTHGFKARRQPDRLLRPASQAGRHAAKLPSSPCSFCSSQRQPAIRSHCLQCQRDRCAQRSQSQIESRKQSGLGTRSAPTASPFGPPGSSPPRRLGRLSIVQAARSLHLQAWPRTLPYHRDRLAAQRRVHAP